MTAKDVSTTPRFEILTPAGWSSFDGVKSSTKKEILELITDTGRKLKCTLDHKIKTNNGFAEVRNLKSGDIIETITGFEKISSLQVNKCDLKVFDVLEVNKHNQYYTNGIVSHNCAWLGSSGTLISGAVLKTLTALRPLSSTDGLTTYVLPEKDHKYVMTCDVSHGKGLDYSAFQVIDVTQMPYNQVCVYKSNVTPPAEYTQTIHQTSIQYNNATILVEINDIGQTVADALYVDYESDNLIFTEKAGPKGKRISAGFNKNAERGLKQTAITKTVGCSLLKLLIEQYQLIINDHDTIYELSRFSKKNSSYEAEPGAHDDLVMALVLFAWMSNQQYFKDLTDINTLLKLRNRTDEDLENEMFSFFMDNGRELLDPNEIEVIDMSKTWNPDFKGLFA